MLGRATLLTFDGNRFAEASALGRKLLGSAEPDYPVAVDRISSPLVRLRATCTPPRHLYASALYQIPTLLDNSPFKI
jgi:hypothetical protein